MKSYFETHECIIKKKISNDILQALQRWLWTTYLNVNVANEFVDVAENLCPSICCQPVHL